MILKDISLTDELSLELSMDDTNYFINVCEYSSKGYRCKTIKQFSKEIYDLDEMLYSLIDFANSIISNAK